jgi:hypothetical protein
VAGARLSSKRAAATVRAVFLKKRVMCITKTIIHVLEGMKFIHEDLSPTSINEFHSH